MSNSSKFLFATDPQVFHLYKEVQLHLHLQLLFYKECKKLKLLSFIILIIGLGIGGTLLYKGINPDTSKGDELFSDSIYSTARKRDIMAFEAQQAMPIYREAVDEMAPTMGNAAGEIARGIRRGLNEADNDRHYRR